MFLIERALPEWSFSHFIALFHYIVFSKDESGVRGPTPRRHPSTLHSIIFTMKWSYVHPTPGTYLEE